MRAVLVVNPQATATTANGRDVLAHALASEVKLELVETNYRGHAREVAHTAARDDIDLIVAHGGDGTVNEVVNGLLADADRAGRPDTAAPVLGVVPGGSANVFARALGVPHDPVDATSRLLHAIEEGSRKRVGLGLAGQRWFTFNAGLGWDADVVAGIDRRRGKRTSPWLYACTALTCYLHPPRGRPHLTVEIPGAEPVEVRTAFVSNTDPWSYLGSRPVRLNPGCSFDTGLGVYAPHTLGMAGVLRQVRQALSGYGAHGGRLAVRRDDVSTARVTSNTEVNLQADGDLVGLRRSVEFRSVPNALTVLV